jgi:hypothetical protein
MTETTVRIVVFREGRFWLAQGLEHDFGVQAEDLKDLVVRVDFALELEAAGLADLPPAPKYFQDLWPLKAGGFTPDVPLLTPGVRIEWGMVA